MKRYLKFGVGLAAIASVLLAATGAVGAGSVFDVFDEPNVAPAVRLCVGTKATVAPTAGICPKATVVVEVADARVAEDLRNRIELLSDSLESQTTEVGLLEVENAAQDDRLAALEQRIKALEPLEPGTLVATHYSPPIEFSLHWQAQIVGENLKPGEVVHCVSQPFGFDCPGPDGVVSADGTVTINAILSCLENLSARWSTTDQRGIEIQSNSLSLGPSCN